MWVQERIGWIISILFHGMLALWLYFMLVDVKPFVLDFTQITFAPVESVNSMDQDGGNLLPTLEGGSPIIELPSRPMITATSPLLKLPERNRPVIESLPTRKRAELTDKMVIKPGKRTVSIPTGSGSKLRPSMESLSLDDELLTGNRNDAMSEQLVEGEMFTISWDEGAPRNKLSGSLPSFPSNVNRAATVKLSFAVAPDGSIVFTTPFTKSDPKLEKVSMDALRSWRFSPLEKSQLQTNQHGVITFVFKLQ